MTANWDDELARLIEATCNGTIAVEEAARLDSRLTSEPAARQFYNNYLFLHGEMYSQHAAACHVPRVESQGLEAASSGARRNSWRSWLAIAAAVVGMSAVSSWLTYSIVHGAQATADVAAAPANENGESV